MKPWHGLAVVALVAFGAVFGFVGHQLDQHPRIQAAVTEAAGDVEATRYFRALGFSCGVEAWDIKVMRDTTTPTHQGADTVNLTPVKTTIPALIAMSGPSGQRLQPGQAYQLTGTRLIKAKLEADSDIHLVLQSTLGSHPTMIAEIPDPGCASGSLALTQITAARAAFSNEVDPPSALYNFVSFNPPLSVTLTGVGLVDFNHGQTGADPHQVELHPLLSFKRLP